MREQTESCHELNELASDETHICKSVARESVGHDPASLLAPAQSQRSRQVRPGGSALRSAAHVLHGQPASSQ